MIVEELLIRWELIVSNSSERKVPKSKDENQTNNFLVAIRMQQFSWHWLVLSASSLPRFATFVRSKSFNEMMRSPCPTIVQCKGPAIFMSSMFTAFRALAYLTVVQLRGGTDHRNLVLFWFLLPATKGQRFQNTTSLEPVQMRRSPTNVYRCL